MQPGFSLIDAMSPAFQYGAIRFAPTAIATDRAVCTAPGLLDKGPA